VKNKKKTSTWEEEDFFFGSNSHACVGRRRDFVFFFLLKFMSMYGKKKIMIHISQLVVNFHIVVIERTKTKIFCCKY